MACPAHMAFGRSMGDMAKDAAIRAPGFSRGCGVHLVVIIAEAWRLVGRRGLSNGSGLSAPLVCLIPSLSRNSGGYHLAQFLTLCLQFPGLPIHKAGSSASLFPPIVILNKLCDGFVRKHLTNTVERFSMKLKCLFKQNFVLDGPLVREGCEVSQILNGPVEVVLMPEEHSESLLSVVPILFL